MEKHMKKNMDKQQLEQAAQSVYAFMMHSPSEKWGDHAWANWAMNRNQWDWNAGVGIIAAAEYGRGRVTGNSGVLQEVELWVSRNISQSEQARVVNSIAPYAVFPLLYEVTGQSCYADKAAEIARWVIDQAPRTRSGALEHTVTEQASFGEQIWADTIFMAVLFLSRTARMVGNTAMADEALQQVLLHLQALQDEETGLLYHGWNCETGNSMSAARWNRANAWNMCGIPMILEEVEGLHRDGAIVEEIKARYRSMASAIIGLQSVGGLWPTVLDKPEFYAETSGSAGIACGLYKAGRQGLISAEQQGAAEKTVAAIVRLIESDGAVTGVSGGTPVLESIEAYNQVPLFPTLYGQGLTLMLLLEAIVQRTSGSTEIF